MRIKSTCILVLLPSIIILNFLKKSLDYIQNFYHFFNLLFESLVSPSTWERVLIVPYVFAHLVNPLADVAITHGGACMIQRTIHSDTPIVGVPLHLEQAGNISLVKRQGAGLMLWKQELSKRRLTSALNQIVSDKRFRENMLRLKQIQDQIDGASKAAQVLVDFVEGKVS